MANHTQDHGVEALRALDVVRDDEVGEHDVLGGGWRQARPDAVKTVRN
jgi:hypothetical protein